MALGAWLIAVLIGFASNVDNLRVGVTCQTRDKGLPLGVMFTVPPLSFAACLLGCLMATHASALISRSELAMISSLIFCVVGLWTIYQGLHERDWQSSTNPGLGEIGFSELMFLGLAQALSELCVGFGAGFANINAIVVACCAGLFSVLCLTLPRFVLWIRLQYITKYACIFSGLFLILLCLYI